MSFLPAGMGGADRKKAMWLAGLVIVIPIAYFLSKASSDTPESSSSSAKTKQGPVDPTAALGPVVNAPVVRKEAPSIMPMKRTPQGGMSRGGGRATEDFKPSLKPKEGVDVSAIDPTLHLDRLARLHNLAMEGGVRSVFKEGSAPPLEAPKVVLVAVGPKQTDAQPPPVVPPTPTGPPPPPPPTPIPLKFYGFASAARSGGAKKAFFLDGEDIQIAGENDLIRNRYKIIRIGVNSAVVEDTTDKHQQTLPLVEEFAG